MRDHAHQRAVGGQQRGRAEGEARVLHAAVREGGRQAEQVVDAPRVRHAAQLLGCFQKGLGVLAKFERHSRHHRRLGPRGRARADGAALELAHRHGQQVGRDGARLRKAEGAPRAAVDGRGRAAVRPRGAHQRGRPARHAHGRLVAELGGGAVLAREQRARVDRLALREHVGVHLARRLLGRQPLHRRALRARLARDLQLKGAAARAQALGQLDAQRAAEHVRLLAQRVRRLGAVEPDRADRELLGVEHDLRGAARADDAPAPRGERPERAARKVDVERELQVLERHFRPVGRRGRVDDWHGVGRAARAQDRPLFKTR